MITDRSRRRARSRSSSTASRSRCSTPCGPGSEHGRIADRPARVARGARGATSTKPVLVFGHHHPWDPSSTERSDHYFGINPDDSDALCAVISRCEVDRRLLRRSHAPQPRAPLRRRRATCRSSRSRASRTIRARGPSTGSTRAATRSSSAASPRPTRWRGPRRPATCSRACTATTRSARSERPLLHASLLVDVRTCRRSTGLRVIDMATVFAGPGAARHLADFGADVIKVEAPARRRRAPHGLVPARGRRLVHVEAARPEQAHASCSTSRPTRGRDALLALADDADVLVENFRPGTLERLGLGPDVLLARNPRLVVLRVTGFGQDGPYAARPGLRHDGRGDERVRRDQRRARRRRRCCRRSRSPTRSPRSRARSR